MLVSLDLTQEEKAAATYNIYYALKKDEKITEKLSNTNTRPRTNLNAQQPASFSGMATIG